MHQMIPYSKYIGRHCTVINVPGGISIYIVGNMIIKKVDCGANDIFGVGVTIPPIIYYLGNISFRPDASLLVCHGGAFFR